MARQESLSPRGQLKINLTRSQEIASSKTMEEVIEWFNEEVAALPEMKVSEANVTDGVNWRADIDIKNGEIKSIMGKQFTISGLEVKTSSFSWNQPIIKQSAEAAETAEGKVDVSGLVLLARKWGTFLVTAQEPGA